MNQARLRSVLFRVRFSEDVSMKMQGRLNFGIVWIILRQHRQPKTLYLI